MEASEEEVFFLPQDVFPQDRLCDVQSLQHRGSASVRDNDNEDMMCNSQRNACTAPGLVISE